MVVPRENFFGKMVPLITEVFARKNIYPKEGHLAHKEHLLFKGTLQNKHLCRRDPNLGSRLDLIFLGSKDDVKTV
jgi:hypothetical protein